MGLISSTARSYAKALMDIKPDARLKIEEELGDVLALLQENRDLKLFYNSPLVPMEVKKKAIADSCKSCTEAIRNLLQLLVDRRREAFLEEIFDAVVEENDQALGRVQAMVIYGHDMKIAKDDQDHEIVKQIKKAILDHREIFGLPQGALDIIVSNMVSEKLKGGIMIRIGDYQYDASVLTYIQKWKDRVENQTLNLESTLA